VQFRSMAKAGAAKKLVLQKRSSRREAGCSWV
jgi:hypothetical protein